MTIVYDKLLSLDIPQVVQTYGEKDAILYALGLGLGLDSLNADELPFVYEKSFKLLPTFAVVLGWPGFWARDLDSGIDWVKLVAGEQGLVLHRPLAPRGIVVGKTRVTEIIDKGPGKGAVIYSERTITDRDSGERIATIVQTTFARGDGGFGGPPREQRPVHVIPERAPDLVCDLPTRPELAPSQYRVRPRVCAAGARSSDTGRPCPPPAPDAGRQARQQGPPSAQGRADPGRLPQLTRGPLVRARAKRHHEHDIAGREATRRNPSGKTAAMPGRHQRLLSQRLHHDPLADGTALRFVGVEQPGRRSAVDHRRELPTEVDGVLQTEVETGPAHR